MSLELEHKMSKKNYNNNNESLKKTFDWKCNLCTSLAPFILIQSAFFQLI